VVIRASVGAARLEKDKKKTFTKSFAQKDRASPLEALKKDWKRDKTRSIGYTMLWCYEMLDNNFFS